MGNISKFILTFFIAMPLVFAFGSQTVKQIDEIKNNTGTDILLNPTDKVDIGYFAGEKALQSTADGELEESAVTNTELGYVSGVTSSIQTQLDSKAIELRNINTTTPLQGGGDLSADRTLSILQSGVAQDGYLSTTDWNTFNNKSDYADPTTTDGDLVYYNSGISRLGIGSNGQVLQVSALGFPEWADLVAVSVTTKGDLQTYSTEPDRLEVGTDSQILSADSSEATGLKWIDLPVSSPITTEGDIAIGDASGNPIRLPIGTTDQILVSDGSTLSYQDIPVSLPDQTGNTGKYLYTTGTAASWRNSQIDDNNTKDNLLECAGFDGCSQEGVITNGAGIDLSGTTTRTVESSAWNTSKLNLTQSAAGTLDYTYTKTANFDGKQLITYCEIKTSNTGVTFNSMKDGVVQSTLNVSSDDTWRYYRIPFIGGATSQGFKVDHVTATEIPDIDIDNCFIGKDANLTQELGQAHFVGDINLSNNCLYNRTNTVLGQFFDSDSTCSATSKSSTLDLPTNTNAAGLKVLNYRTDGVYRISYQGLLYNSGNANVCYFNIDKTATVNSGEIYVGTGGGGARGLSHVYNDIRFETGDTGEVFIWGRNNGGTQCSVYGTSGNKAYWSVHFYPDANSTVVTQDTELTVETANEFVGGISSDKVTIYSQNFDIFTCVSQGTGDNLCTYNNPALFSSPPTVQLTVSDGSGLCREVRVSGSGTSNFRYQTFSSAGSVTNCGIQYNITRGADYNKSQTIVGKFEQIASDNLESIEIWGNAGETVTASTNMPYATVVNDLKGQWDGDEFTLDHDACYEINLGTRTTTNDQQSLRVLINNVNTDYIQIPTVSYTIHTFTFGRVCANSGDKISFRFSAGSNTLSNSGYHRLIMTELPDTASIIKNLNDNNTTKCQTKLLSANSTSSGVLSDLTLNNLDISKNYSVSAQVSFVYAEGNTCRFLASDSINTILRQWSRGGNSTLARDINSAANQFFKPATSTVTFSFTESGAGACTIEGNNSYATTYVTLCELPDSVVETTEF